jgi:DNA-directed RNA polymerase I subunit RPA1
MDEVLGKTPPKKSTKGKPQAAAGAAAAAAQSPAKKGKKKQLADEGADEDEDEESEQPGFEFDGDYGTGLAAYDAAYGEGSGRRVQQLPKTCHIQEAMRTAVAEFFSRIPATKCQNCGCINPTIKKQGSTKLFKQYTRKGLLQNHMRGIDVAAAVGAARQAAAAAAAAEATAAAAAVAAVKKRKRAAAAAAAEDDTAAEDEQAAKKTTLLGLKQGYQDAELKKGEDMKDDTVRNSDI